MTAQQMKDIAPAEDQNAQLEKSLIAEYLREKGYSLETLSELPAALAERLMKEASQYASLKLEEVESRARLVKELQEDSSPLQK